jgi:transcriptional regulator with XRE-family HTH domain
VQPRTAKQLGRRLNQRRQALGLTIRDLEALSGVDDSSIVRLENGQQSRPSVEKLDKLAKALRLPIEDLLSTAGLTTSTGLPSLRPYLRAKYGQLPAEAHAELDRYFARLGKRYGVSFDGPAPGEDEAPEGESTTKRKGGSHARTTTRTTGAKATKQQSAEPAARPRARTPGKRT